MLQFTVTSDDGNFSLSPEAAFAAFGDMVYRLAYAKSGTREDADDILQDVFLRYLRRMPPLSSMEHAKAWFLKVTVRCAATQISKRAKHAASPLPENKGYQQIIGKSDLFYAVMELPETFREVVYLYYYEGYTTAQIARIVGVKEGTVKSRLFRARESLRNRLEGSHART